MSDSLKIVATGEDDDRLEAVIALSPFDTAQSVTVEDRTLVFKRFASEGDEGRVPFPLKLPSITQIAIDWLNSESRDYGPKPNIDGSLHKGWHVEASNMTWKICVTPHWMIYHK